MSLSLPTILCSPSTLSLSLLPPWNSWTNTMVAGNHATSVQYLASKNWGQLFFLQNSLCFLYYSYMEYQIWKNMFLRPFWDRLLDKVSTKSIVYDLDVQEHPPVWDLDRGTGLWPMYIWYIKVVYIYFLGPSTYIFWGQFRPRPNIARW